MLRLDNVLRISVHYEESSVVECSSATAKRDRFGHFKRSLSLILAIAGGDTVCPQETSNARHVASLAGLKTRQEYNTTTSEDRKNGMALVPAAFN